MALKDHTGVILIAIGIILTLTIILFFIGIPLIIIGTYYLNKKVNKKEKEIEGKLEEKRNELANIDIKLEKLEKEKEKEINIKLERLEKETKIKLEEKRNELLNIDNKLNELEEEKEKEINIKLEEKKTQLANIDTQLEEKAKEKEKEINIELSGKQTQLNDITIMLNNMDNELKEKKKELIFVEDEIEMQEIGLYEPQYNFTTAILYKEKLDEIRKKQKDYVKNKKAALSGTWVVEGDKRKGKAMENANIKQIIKTFNLECESTISKVKLSNRENSIKRIKRSFESLNTINKPNNVKITPEYLNLKLEELNVAIEYELKKQEEKDILREEREREREEKKIQKEFDDQFKEVIKQQKKLEIEIEATNNLLQKSESDEKTEFLKSKLKELKLSVEKNKKDEEDIKEKRKRTGAGYVYILSNIGSFGENVYKIGVTRRDDPQDRINELSNASVPFKFDSHVFIFSKEAFDLEKELHDRFDHKRVNKINKRKEFFNIQFDDVKNIVEEYKDLVHSFNDKPEAQEYHDSLKLEKNRK